MIYVLTYFTIAYALFAWTAYIDRHSIREAFTLSVLWPITLFVVVPWMIAGAILQHYGFLFNIQYMQNLSMFGYRKRPLGEGFALRTFRFEFQFYKNDKKYKPRSNRDALLSAQEVNRQEDLE